MSIRQAFKGLPCVNDTLQLKKDRKVLDQVLPAGTLLRIQRVRDLLDIEAVIKGEYDQLRGVPIADWNTLCQSTWSQIVDKQRFDAVLTLKLPQSNRLSDTELLHRATSLLRTLENS